MILSVLKRVAGWLVTGLALHGAMSSCTAYCAWRESQKRQYTEEAPQSSLQKVERQPLSMSDKDIARCIDEMNEETEIRLTFAGILAIPHDAAVAAALDSQSTMQIQAVSRQV